MQPTRGRRRFSATTGVLAVLCLMSFLMYVDRTNISTAALAIRRDLNLNNSQLGLVFSAIEKVVDEGFASGCWSNHCPAVLGEERFQFRLRHARVPRSPHK